MKSSNSYVFHLLDHLFCSSLVTLFMFVFIWCGDLARFPSEVGVRLMTLHLGIPTSYWGCDVKSGSHCTHPTDKIGTAPACNQHITTQYSLRTADVSPSSSPLKDVSPRETSLSGDEPGETSAVLRLYVIACSTNAR